MTATNDPETAAEREKARHTYKKQISRVTDEFLKMVTDCREFLALVVDKGLSVHPSTLKFMRNKNVKFSLIHAAFKNIMLFDFQYP